MDLLGSGSSFDVASATLEALLQRSVRAAPLSAQELARYDRTFVVGWRYQRDISGENYLFHVLVDRDFPRSPIRVALTSHEKQFVWPHVEKHGLLCLPSFELPIGGIENALALSIDAAEHLVSRCLTDDAFVRSEFAREFLSYWDKSVSSRANPLYSLLDVTDAHTRLVWASERKGFSLIGETEAQVSTWLSNQDVSAGKLERAIAARLSRPPIPPYPRSAGDFLRYLDAECPEALALLIDWPLRSSDPLLVLSAETETGVGSVGVRLEANEKQKGGWSGKALQPRAARAYWASQSHFRMIKDVRVDGAWVHGRGQNEDYATLKHAQVAVLGCGSVGSHVAVLLAQAGVGGMVLVDPEALAPANVGRHVLGIDSISMSKAVTLAGQLRRRFPHIAAAEGCAGKWEQLGPEKRAQIENTSLIVSCIGDWGSEGLLNEWHIHEGAPPPVVYGWLDEYGTAAHAVSILGSSPCLSCVINDTGKLREPETMWPDDTAQQAEPACGTLFQPFGPVDVVHAAALTATLAIDVLIGKAGESQHRVYAGPTQRLTALGGSWSDNHLKARPPGFQGAFEYERKIARCDTCSICTP